MNLLRTAAVLSASVATAALVSPAALASSASTASTASTAGTTGAGPNAAPTGHTQVVSDCLHRRTEPRVVIAACGDGGVFIRVGHYSSWTATAATGRGRLVVDTCTPDCAHGRYRRFPATFRFTAVRHPSAGPVFSRIRVRTVSHGHVHHETLYPPTRPEAA